MESYNILLEKFKKIIVYKTIQGQLGWDFETYMPPKGGEQRATQFAQLASDIHKMTIDPEIGKLIESIKSDKEYSSLSEEQKRNVYLIEKEFNKQTKLPSELVEEISRQQVISTECWKKAKKKQNYSLFKSDLQKSLDLQKKRANYLDPDKHPYDVLLDLYEPNMTSEMITNLFNKLKEGLIPLLKKIQSAPKQPDTSFLTRTVPIDIQEKLSIDIANVVQYDLEKGSIDTTEHPFTTGYYDDVRITTQYFEKKFAFSLWAVLHEAGHGIYDQNLSPDYKYQPLGDSASYGIHESQSRFYENILGLSIEFWKYYYPRFQEITGDIFSNISLEAFTHAVNDVKPSKIRIEADEVTYSLHVIIRFEIERDLITGKISLDELPSIWNQKYHDYLGIDIENDAEGVLQDTHWASGYVGYFPSYALGNIYNAHMLHAIRKKYQNYDEMVESGEFKPIFDWLIENVHRYSNLYDPSDLMMKITGESINPQYFIDYLTKKYSKLYGF